MKAETLIVAHSALRGGAEYCLDTTLRQLDRDRFNVSVVFPFEGPMSDVTRNYGYDVRIAPLCYCLNFGKSAWYWRNLLGRSWANVLRLRQIVHDTKAALVYTNCASIFESAVAARLAGVPHVWHVHEVLANGNRMQQLLPLPIMKRLIYRLSDRIVFESHSARRVFETSTRSDKSEVVYNSVRLLDESAQPDAAQRNGDEVRARFALSPGDRVLGFVGQFNDRKNPLALIGALAKVRGLARLKCLFAGEGPLEGAMRNEIRRLDLDSVCRIVGFQADVGPVMRAIDALVLPSRQESFGLVLVEAASHGKPAIACQCEGPSEIIVEGKTGLLVAQNHESELARAIEKMFADEWKRKHMGEAARRRAKEEFCSVKNTRKLEQVFVDVIQDPRGRRCTLPSSPTPYGESVGSEACPGGSLKTQRAPYGGAHSVPGWLNHECNDIFAPLSDEEGPESPRAPATFD